MIIYFSDTAEFCCEQAAIAQSVVRNIGSVEVTSSILVSSFGEGAPGGVLFSIAIVYGIW